MSSESAEQRKSLNSRMGTVAIGLVLGAVFVPPLLWAAVNYWADVACENWPDLKVCAIAIDSRIKRLEHRR